MKLEKLNYPLIIAHRGYRQQFPENTLAAFQGALDIGVQMLELDVTLTKDLALVVIHDDTLDRTTNGRGIVGNQTLETIKKLDAGSWFHPDFANEKVPTLAEVLDLVGDQATVNIEIKSVAHLPAEQAEQIENLVLETVVQKNAVASVLISSFEQRSLEKIASRKNRPAIALLSEKANELGKELELCQRLGCFSWHPKYRQLTESRITKMHEFGIRVFPYTVNARQEIVRLIDMGADGFFSDDPLLYP